MKIICKVKVQPNEKGTGTLNQKNGVFVNAFNKGNYDLVVTYPTVGENDPHEVIASTADYSISPQLFKVFVKKNFEKTLVVCELQYIDEKVTTVPLKNQHGHIMTSEYREKYEDISQINLNGNDLKLYEIGLLNMVSECLNEEACDEDSNEVKCNVEDIIYHYKRSLHLPV